MNFSHDHCGVPGSISALDGFDVLDVCHRQTVYALGKLAALVSRLTARGPDPQARELAAEILLHFSTTAREHHEDEERHVFPQLLTRADPDLVQVVMRLQQDHHWLAEDWMLLSPHIDAVACGHTGYDLDLLREGAAVFTALSHDHMALEESIVYPQARAGQRAGDRSRMGSEMAARRRKLRARTACHTRHSTSSTTTAE